jgi:hypothetical protein
MPTQFKNGNASVHVYSKRGKASLAFELVFGDLFFLFFERKARMLWVVKHFGVSGDSGAFGDSVLVFNGLELEKNEKVITEQTRI